MSDPDERGPHEVSPYRDTDKRAKCRVCGAFVVGTPAGWFHTSEPVAALSGSSEQDDR